MKNRKMATSQKRHVDCTFVRQCGASFQLFSVARCRYIAGTKRNVPLRLGYRGLLAGIYCDPEGDTPVNRLFERLPTVGV